MRNQWVIEFFMLGIALAIGFVLGSASVNRPKEIFCESGTEITGNDYDEEWSAICNFDSVYGEQIKVTMID